MANKPKRQISLAVFFITFAGLVISFVGLIFLQEKLNPQRNQEASQLSKSSEGSSVKTVDGFTSTSELPRVNTEDWALILVNQDNSKEEMNPELTEVAGVQVDSRIAEATTNFLLAAQAIDANAHIVLGYRSFDDQKALFDTAVQQEMAAQGITQEAAETVVKTYSQQAGTSEHMTGLAIDLSTVGTLNQMDATIASQIAAIAPNYGFVLRYKSEYTEQTDVAYEDWHFRYVGHENATYMTNHNIPLESYLSLLKQASE